MIESDLTFRAPLTIAKLELLGNALPPARLPDTMMLVYANRSTDAPTTVNVSALATAETLMLSLVAGGWFAVLSPADSGPTCGSPAEQASESYAAATRILHPRVSARRLALRTGGDSARQRMVQDPRAARGPRRRCRRPLQPPDECVKIR